MKLSTNKELLSFITPLSEEEKSQLKANIIKEGCREPLTVWDKSENEKVIVDGHNRYDICQQNDIDFEVTYLNFADLEEVKTWMVDNQLGRRNLNPLQLSYFRGIKYELLKKQKGGYDKVQSKGQKVPLTSELLADQFKVSEKTVKRDAQLARGLQIIERSNPTLKSAILKGEAKVKKSDVSLLSFLENTQGLKFKSEADIIKKAREIEQERDTRLNAVENEIESRLAKANQALEEREPLFVSREDRLNRLKGKILSTLNKAIQQKSKEQIKELMELIKQLEVLIEE